MCRAVCPGSLFATRLCRGWVGGVGWGGVLRCVSGGSATGPRRHKDKLFLVILYPPDRQTDRPKYLGGWQRGTLKPPVMRSAAMKETSSCPKLLPIPSSPRLPFWRRLKALFRLYLMSLFWLLFNPRVGSHSAPILALVQAPLWLCFGVGFIVAAFQQSLSLPPPTFSFSTPGSWPSARHADQWEIQAQAFCLGWHFAFVFPFRL